MWSEGSVAQEQFIFVRMKKHANKKERESNMKRMKHGISKQNST